MATERYNTIINVEYRGHGDVARYVADLRRMAQEMASAQGMLSLIGTPGSGGPLALPAGTGTPRVGGRFVSREREIEMRQGEFLNALRDRIAAERAATAAARQRAYEDRVASIASRPGASMSFGAVGNIEIAFERHGRSIASGLAEMDRRIAALTSTLSTVQAQIIDRRGPFSAQRVNTQTALANAGALQSFVASQTAATNATTNVLGMAQGDQIEQLIEAGFARALQQDWVYRALVQGGVNSKLAKMLPEESMVALTGGSYQDNRTRGVFQGHGLAPITIPGYTNNTAVRAEMAREATDAIHAELSRLEAARAQIAPIALGRTSAAAEQQAMAQRAREVLRGVELQRILNGLVQQEIAAYQRANAKPQRMLGAPDAPADEFMLQRARNAIRRQDARFVVDKEYPLQLPPDVAQARGLQPSVGIVRAITAVEGTIGRLEFSLQTGEIAMVRVAEGFRRMGLASEMLRTAREAGYEVRHSDLRTVEGEAWARSTGDLLPVNQGSTPAWFFRAGGQQDDLPEFLRSGGAVTAGEMGLTPPQIAALQRRYPELQQRLNDALQRRIAAEEAATGTHPALGRPGRPATRAERWPVGTEFHAIEGEAWASHPGYGMMGKLNWNPMRGNEIESVSVLPEFRRMGIASQILATAIEKGYSPQHSNERTPAGNAWARAVGGYLPNNDFPADPWYQGWSGQAAENNRLLHRFYDSKRALAVPEGGRQASSETPWMDRFEVARYLALQASLNEAIRRRKEAEDAATGAARSGSLNERVAIGGGAGGAGNGGRRGGGGGGYGGYGDGWDDIFGGGPDPFGRGRGLSFNQLIEQIMGGLTRASRGPSDPVGAAELRVKTAEDNLVLAKDRYNNSLEFGFGPEGRKAAREADVTGGVYDSREAAEMDVTRKLQTLIGAQNSLNRAIEARTKAEQAAAAAADKTAQANAQFRSAYDEFIRTRGQVPLALTAGSGGGAMGSYFGQAGGQQGSFGGAPGGYKISDADQALWTRWMQQSGAIPTPPAPTALQAAQQAHAAAQQAAANAQQAHTSTLNGTYANQKAAGQAFVQSLYNLTNAQNRAAQAQQTLANVSRIYAVRANQAPWGHVGAPPGSGGGSRGGGGGGWYGGGGYGGWGQAGMNAPGSGAGGFAGFMAGFRGNPDRSYMEMLGQTARFSVMYGAMYKILFALTQTLSQTLQEGILFQQAMTDLKIASGRSEAALKDLATSVSKSAIEAGLAPSQGIQLAARSLGLYGATDADQARQESVATISSQVASRMATGSKKDPFQLQTELAATVNAFQLDATGQQMVADLDAYMTKKFGMELGSTLETLAQSGSVGSAAGFSLEEQTAVAALMAARTGQTPSAVGGFMAQIFSRGGEGSLVDVAKEQGIDANQQLVDIIGQLADAYKTASPRDQQEISAAFGRGKIQNAAVALLEGWDEVQLRAGEARTDAIGAADEQWRQRMQNMGGELAILSGLMKEFAAQLGQAGLLDVIGAGVLVLQEFFTAVNGLLSMWNMLGDTTQRVVIGMGLLLAAIRSETLQRALSARANMAAGLGGFYGKGVGGPVSRIPGAVATAGTGALGGIYASGAGVGAAGLAGVGAGAMAKAGMAAAAGLLFNPITIAIGGLLAIGSLKASSDRMGEAMDGAAAILADTTPLTTPDDYRARAALLTTQAGENRNATGWLMQALTLGRGNDGNIEVAERLETEAERLVGVANRMAAREAASVEEQPVFASFATDDLKEGLENITASGGTATERLAALRDVLLGAAGAASAAADAFQVDAFAEENAGAISSLAANVTPTLADKFATGMPGFVGGLSTVGEKAAVARGFASSLEGDFDPNSERGKERLKDLQDMLRRRVEEELTGTEVEERLQEGLDELGVEKLGDLNGKTSGRLAAIVGEGVAAKVLEGSGASPETIAAFQDELNKSIKEYLLDKSANERRLLRPNSRLSAEEATGMAQLLVGESDAALSGLQDSDYSGRQKELRSRIQLLNRTQRRTDEPNAYIQEQIVLARRALAEAQFQEFEGLRQVAMQQAKNKREANAIGRSMLVSEINRAIKGGNADLLIEIIQQAGMGARSIVKKAIADAIAVARAAIAEARKMLENLPGIGVLADPIGSAYGSPVPGMPQSPEDKKKEKEAREAAEKSAAAQKEIDRLNKLDKALRTSPSAGPDNDVYTWKGMDVYNPNKAEEEALEEDKETRAEREAARAEAYAIRSQGGMDAARASIQSARAALAKAEAGSVEYWNAMGQLFQAQNDLADAQRAYQNNLRLLRIDITNPLQEARVATQAAAQKLREDLRAGKAPDVIAQDRVDLRRAQASQEATAFQQRLSTVQTAEELGRISHAKYMNYLRNEKRRLEGIKNRTFQQQEQLNTIDRAMKDAANSMDAMWNFGDINTRGMAYQMRRYVEESKKERRANLAAQQATRMQGYAQTLQSVNINIDGADLVKVRKVLEDLLGKRVRTTQARRR